MPREDFNITTVGERSLSAVVQTLLQRRVHVVELVARRWFEDDHDGFEIRLAADVESGEASELLVKRLHRLVDVVKIVKTDSSSWHQRRAVVVQVEVQEDGRWGALQIASVYGAEIVDICAGSLSLAMFAPPNRVEELIRLLYPFGSTTVVDGGPVSISRGRRRRASRGLPDGDRLACTTSAPAPSR